MGKENNKKSQNPDHTDELNSKEDIKNESDKPSNTSAKSSYEEHVEHEVVEVNFTNTSEVTQLQTTIDPSVSYPSVDTSPNYPKCTSAVRSSSARISNFMRMQKSLNKGDLTEFVNTLNNYIEKLDDQEIGQIRRDFDQHSTILNFNTTDQEGNTVLHIAAQQNFTNVIDFLLKNDTIDVNIRNSKGDTPIMLAAREGYYNTLKKLLDDERISLKPGTGDISNITILHSLLQGMKSLDMDHPFDDEDRLYHKCLEYVLEKLPTIVEDPCKFVNLLDPSGQAALHYAVQIRDEEAILRLLQAGSYVHYKTQSGGSILRDIGPSILMKYLDSCVSINKNTRTIYEHELSLNYNIFNAPDQTASATLIQHLLSLTDQPKLWPILTHPIVDIYLSYQWNKMQIYYWCNVFLCVLFCLMLNSHIVMLNVSDEVPRFIADPIRIILAILMFVLIVRELVQFITSPSKYFKLIENFMELSLIVVTFGILKTNTLDSNFSFPLIAIVLSFYELMQLIGKHPRLSTNTQIFKSVALNFSKLLLQYCTIILAYVFCCYTASNRMKKISTNDSNITKNENSDHHDFYTTLTNITKSVIGTIVILTNPPKEPDNVNNSLGINHLMFLLGSFFLTIVLANLMNGLAIDEIANIRKNAILHGIISRINFMWYIDRTLGKNALVDLIKNIFICSCCRRKPKLHHVQSHCILMNDIEQGYGTTTNTSELDSGNDTELGNARQTISTRNEFDRSSFQILHPSSNALPNNKISILLDNRNIAVASYRKSDKISQFSWKIDQDLVERVMKIVEERETLRIDDELSTKQTRDLEYIKLTMKSLTNLKEMTPVSALEKNHDENFTTETKRVSKITENRNSNSQNNQDKLTTRLRHIVQSEDYSAPKFRTPIWFLMRKVKNPHWKRVIKKMNQAKPSTAHQQHFKTGGSFRCRPFNEIMVNSCCTTVH